MIKIKEYFSCFEISLWIFSVGFIIISFLVFDRENYITLITSIVGATSLIFCAKGNPFGQLLMIIFSVFYGIISFTYSYYGEMITYLGMTAPMALFSLISWLKNPYKNNKSQVTVNHINKKQIFFMCFYSITVTIVFYFILKWFNTANIFLSTISVTTSFIAVYLTFYRSPYYAIGYALNDIVLIILWTMAIFDNIQYLSVVICFIVFLFNDIYGFISWCKMYNMQNSEKDYLSI